MAELAHGLLSGSLGHLGVGGAEDKKYATGDGRPAVRIGQVMTQHRQLVMFPRQGGGTGAAALLFQREVTGPLPVQVVAVGIVQGTIVIPRSGAQDGEPLPLTAGDMTGREGAAIGNEQELPQRQVLVQEGELFGDGAMAVVIAIGGVTEKGYGTEVVDGRADT